MNLSVASVSIIFAIYFFSGAAFGQVVPPGLLVAVQGPGNVPELVNSIPGNHAFYRANPNALKHGRLELLLPHGDAANARRLAVDSDDDRLIWKGVVDGDPRSSVILVQRAEVLVGTIRHRGRLYKIDTPNNGFVRVSEMKPRDPAPEDTPVVVPDLAASLPDDGETATDTHGSIMDILVAYTPAALATQGNNVNSMLALIDLAVAETNAAYQNSRIDASIRLVHAVGVDYDESDGFSNALSRLRSQTDGYMDEVHPLRDEYGADLVALIIDNPDYCGIAYIGPREDLAFSVTEHACATGYFSFGHEIGHNEGSQHDRANAGSSLAYPYSYGYQEPGNSFRTVMAYNCDPYCPRVQHFSNPDVYYSGLSTGIDYDLNPADSADNARSINNTSPLIAGFRSPVTPPSTIPASPTDLIASAESYESIALRWTDNAGNEDGYVINRSRDYLTWTEVARIAADSTYFQDLGLNQATTYFYNVQAYNSLGYSAESNEASATTWSMPQVPVAVTGLTVDLNSVNAVEIRWVHSNENVDYFEVLREKRNRKGNWTGASIIGSVQSPGNTYTDQPDGGTYRYQVRPVGAGGQGDWVVSTPIEVPKTKGGGGKKCNPRKQACP